MGGGGIGLNPNPSLLDPLEHFGHAAGAGGGAQQAQKKTPRSIAVPPIDSQQGSGGRGAPKAGVAPSISSVGKNLNNGVGSAAGKFLLFSDITSFYLLRISLDNHFAATTAVTTSTITTTIPIPTNDMIL